MAHVGVTGAAGVRNILYYGRYWILITDVLDPVGTGFGAFACWA